MIRQAEMGREQSEENLCGTLFALTEFSDSIILATN